MQRNRATVGPYNVRFARVILQFLPFAPSLVEDNMIGGEFVFFEMPPET